MVGGMVGWWGANNIHVEGWGRVWGWGHEAGRICARTARKSAAPNMWGLGGCWARARCSKKRKKKEAASVGARPPHLAPKPWISSTMGPWLPAPPPERREMRSSGRQAGSASAALAAALPCTHYCHAGRAMGRRESQLSAGLCFAPPPLPPAASLPITARFTCPSTYTPLPARPPTPPRPTCREVVDAVPPPAPGVPALRLQRQALHAPAIHLQPGSGCLLQRAGQAVQAGTSASALS